MREAKRNVSGQAFLSKILHLGLRYEFILLAMTYLAWCILPDLIYLEMGSQLRNSFRTSNETLYYGIAALIVVPLWQLAPKSTFCFLPPSKLKKSVLLICLSLTFTNILVSFLVNKSTTHGFEGSPWTYWILSSLTQEVVFAGLIYGLLEKLFPVEPTNRKLARFFPTHLCLTAVLFGAWHFRNHVMIDMSLLLNLGQIILCTMIYLIILQTRRLSGSILFTCLSHVAVNAIFSLV